MGKIFAGIFFSFFALLVIHIFFLVLHIFLWITEGLVLGIFVETIYFSVLLKWIFGQTTFREALKVGSVVADGDNSRVIDFFDKFEPFNQVDDVAIAVR